MLIFEHYSYDPDKGSGGITFAMGQDEGKLRVSLDRVKRNAIASMSASFQLFETRGFSTMPLHD